MGKYTPGPWKVNHHSHIHGEQWLSVLDGAFDITHNGASKPCVVADSKYSAMSDEENLANALLIASAPEMYEALWDIKRGVANGIKEIELQAICDVAILKATGR